MADVCKKTKRTYDVGPDTELPDLTGGRVTTVAVSDVAELQATYVDTNDLDLAAAEISLRSRAEGPDPGWQLALPADEDTEVEIRRAAGRGVRVPVALTRLLTAVTTGSALSARVVMSTTRTSRHLSGADGTVVANVHDDLVTATEPEGTPVQLRQVEVEVVDGDQVLLDQIHRALTEVGMQRSSWASKLQRALRDVDPAGQQLDPEPALSKETAGATLHRYLVGQRRALTRADLAVRTISASVHDVRVAARRLRAALTVYRRLLDADRARHLQGELQWIGRELSDLRDAEVAGEALFAALEDEPDLGADDSARGLVQRELTATEGRASAAAETALASGRYLALLTQLDMLCAAPPWTDQASESADTALPKVLAKPHRRLRRAAKAAAAAGPDERTSSLHEVRKCAKRLRYSLEVAEPALGDPAHRLANATKHVQSQLGDHLDAVALGEWLLRLGHDPDARAAAFTLGRLHARNEERIPLPLDDYRRAVKQVLRKKNSAFLRTA